MAVASCGIPATRVTRGTGVHHDLCRHNSRSTRRPRRRLPVFFFGRIRLESRGRRRLIRNGAHQPVRATHALRALGGDVIHPRSKRPHEIES